MAAFGSIDKCRLCLKLGEFYSIFTEDNSVQLARMVMACSEVEIYEGDGLPDKICSECIEKLSAAYIFKQQCERSDSELRRSLKLNGGGDDRGFEDSKRRLSKRRREDKSPPTNSLLKERYSVYVSQNSKRRRLSDSSNSFSSNSVTNSVKDNLSCTKCNLVFKSFQGKNSHQRMHKNDAVENVSKEYTYDDSQDENKSHLKQIDTDSNNTTTQCEICRRVFKRHMYYLQHVSRGPCGESLKVQQKLGTLNTTVMKIQPSVQCCNCEAMFKDHLVMLRHYYRCVQVHGVKRLMCMTCNVKYAFKKSLVNHIRLKHIFNNDSSKNNDETKKKQKGGNFQCHKCSRVFENQTKLVMHLAAHMVNLDDKSKLLKLSTAAGLFRCPRCPKRFRFKSSLNNHIKIHRDRIPILNTEKPFKCDLCSMSFEFSKNLAIHKTKKHTEMTADTLDQQQQQIVRFSKIPARCLHCNLILINKRETKLHNLFHLKNGEKPKNEYLCPECDLKFTNTKTFHLHYKEHGVRPFGDDDDDDVVDTSITSFCEVTSDLPEDTSGVESMSLLNFNDQSAGDASSGLVCTICNESFATLKAYQSHMDLHVSAVPASDGISCFICSEDFDSDLDYQNHMKIHYHDKNIDPSLLVCKICKRPSKNMRAFIAHMSWHSQLDNYRCYICNATFPYQNRYTEHMISIHDLNIRETCDVTLFQCNICDKYYMTEDALQYHLMCHKKEENLKNVEYKCSHCGKQFPKKYSLITHLLSHNISFNANLMLLEGSAVSVNKKRDKEVFAKEKTIKCDHCDSMFVNRAGLSKHVSSIHNKSYRSSINTSVVEKPHVCALCKKSFVDDEELKVHIVTHEKKPYLFKCTICSAKSISMKSHLIHLSKVHLYDTITEPFKCSECDEVFSRRLGLRTHMRTAHSISEDFVIVLDKEELVQPDELKELQCNICERMFENEPDYNKHMSRHTDARCDRCFKTFTSKAFVITHKQYYCDNKPESQSEAGIKCRICYKTFSLLVKLQCHMKVKHSTDSVDSSSSVCDFCFSVFNSAERMAAHKRSHYVSTVQQCRFCAKKVKNSYYKKHKKAHYNDTFESQPLRCDHCDETFLRIRDYSNHLSSAHAESIVWFMPWQSPIEECDICHKQFPNILRHKQYHEKFKCKKCLAYFYSGALLSEHVCEAEAETVVEDRTPSVEPLGECEFCFKPYKTEFGKNKHITNHRNLFYSCCRLCNKRFPLKGPLKSHIASAHTFEVYDRNPLKCRHCEDVFTAYAAYSSHMQDVHGDYETLDYLPEFPLTECLICKKSFTNIHRHYKYHQEMQCLNCYKYFISQKLFTAHRCGDRCEESSKKIISFDGDISNLLVADHKLFKIRRVYEDQMDDDFDTNVCVKIQPDLDSEQEYNRNSSERNWMSFDNFSPVISSTMSLSSPATQDCSFDHIQIKSEPIDP